MMHSHVATRAAWFTLMAMLRCSPCHAAEPEKITPAPPSELKAKGIESLLDELLSQRGSREDFEQHIARARQAGLQEQVLLEARFLYCVDQDQASLPQLIPALEAMSSQFSVDQSKIFATREDFLAVIEYCRAMAALAKNDDQAFKQHICEAFWLSPTQAGAYAPCIEKWRLARHIATATIDISQRLDGLIEPNALSLANALDQSSALLLHFWSPWNDDEASRAQLRRTVELAQDQGVFIASVLADPSTENIREAKSLLSQQPPIAHWQQWVELQDHKLAHALRVTDLPTLVLISREGRVLYHGGMETEALKKNLQSLNNKKTEPTSDSADASTKP